VLGVEARIFVPAGTSPARIEAIESEGTCCFVIDGSYDDAVVRSAQEASESCLVISDTSWPGYEQVCPMGYGRLRDDLRRDRQLAGNSPDVVVIQVGVGALGAADVQHFQAGDKAPCRLIAVEPDSAACLLASVEAGRLVTVPGPHQSMGRAQLRYTICDRLAIYLVGLRLLRGH
jgi:diaminopropionate ammonia-lyase